MQVRARYPVILLATLLAVSVAPRASADDQRLQSPRWMVELKGGQFEPDLDDYATFYGDDTTDYFAFAVAYRKNHWLEFGGELGYSRDRGVGQLPQNQQLGGSVTYTLMPLQAFVNLRGDFSEDQLFVPYAGIGIATTFYKQDVEGQSDRSGRSDLGYSARLGIALSLNRLDPYTAKIAARGALKKTYAFLEAQQVVTEQDDTDLGGLIYLFGLRFEIDQRSDEERIKPAAE